MKVLYLFGPNLGALGHRDPQVYGSETLEDIMQALEVRATDLGHELAWRQSDHEGDLVGWLLTAGADGHDAVVDQPRRPDPLLLCAARRRRGLRRSGDRGAHDQHLRPGGVPAPLGGVGGLPGHRHRPGSRWLSSGTGGDAVDPPEEDRAGRADAAFEVDAFLITGLTNVRYLTGFTGSNGQVLVTEGGGVFFTDGRYTEQSRHEVPDLERVAYRGGFGEALASELGARNLRRVGFEANHVTVRTHRQLTDELADVELVATADEIERLRWVKDEEELEPLVVPRRSPTAFDDMSSRISRRSTSWRSPVSWSTYLRRDGADGTASSPSWRSGRTPRNRIMSPDIGCSTRVMSSRWISARSAGAITPT